MTRYSFAACLTAMVFAATTLPARADAIDGQWCDRDGRSFKIDGPNILTPGGTTTTGDYDRHAFRYVIPAGEADAGQTVEMVLHGDDDLALRRGAADGAQAPSEQWRRCQVVS